MADIGKMEAQQYYQATQPYVAEVLAQPLVGQLQPQVVVIHQATRGREVRRRPKSHCFLAWFSCIFCFCPVGLFAVIYSGRANSRWVKGDFVGATEAADTAETLSYIAIIVGISLPIIYKVTGIATGSW